VSLPPDEFRAHLELSAATAGVPLPEIVLRALACNPRRNRDLLRRGPDEAKRKQIYWELQRHLPSGAPSAIPVAWVEGFHFVDKKVRGYKFAPTVYDNNTFLKVWLAQ
jgi:hypothetical protein